jgi:hypothetical protein
MHIVQAAEERAAAAGETAAAAEAFLRSQDRWRLLGDLARVDAVLAAWDEWPDHPDRKSGLTREALEELRTLLAEDLARLAGR